MNNPLSKLTIKGKMILLIVLPVIALLYFTLTELNHHFRFQHKVEQVRQLVHLSESLSRLVHETQKERGASAGYTGSRGKKFTEILPKQRELTDRRIKEYEATLQTIDLTQYPPALKSRIDALNADLARLPEMRRKITALQLPLKDVVGYFTKMNAKMLNIVALSSKLSPSEKITKDLVAYTSFLKSKERAGIERAVLSGTFAADKFSPGMYRKLIKLIAEQDAYMDDFLSFAPDRMVAFYKKEIQNPAFAKVQKMRDIAIAHAIEGGFDVNAEYWFKTITKKINVLKKIDDYIAAETEKDLNTFHDTAIIDTIIGIVVILIMLIVAGLSVKDLELRLNSLKGLITTIAQSKDLTTQIRVYEHDEFGSIREALRDFLKALHDFASHAQKSANENKAVSDKLDHTFDEITDNIKQEAAIVDEGAQEASNLKNKLLSSNTEAASTKENMLEANQSLQETISLVQNTIAQIEQNAVVENDLAQRLQQLSQDAEQVKEVLTVISDIADQTNLLALNAAIEAARAGEHGRGFAVVADEVRKLAERTQKSLADINATINIIVQAIMDSSTAMNRNIENVNRLTEDATRVESEIGTVSSKMTEAVGSVETTAQAIDEAAKIMEAFIQKMEEIKKLSETNKQSILSSDENVKRIGRLADEVLRQISQFKV
ncbi:methyl-accepting chemotaxis protein [Hydrogenimonas sp. SS33]|uniref:methyl-accepting chemotaxis protein n=1 Tax=Hydrogenimonas leucolamina TaxID=2954236 RepID=UPI00336C30AA